MTQRPDYQQLQDALEKADADMYASESHGALCGMICAAGQADLETWLKQVFVDFDLNNMHIKEASQLLAGLFENAKIQLNDAEAGFQLLLPEDNDSLEERVEALAQWCQGFTYGLAAGGLKKDQKLPEDTAELLQDMVEIGRAAHAEEEAGEADEDAYMQLCEYVRMGVLLINEELQPMPPTTDIQH